MLAALVRRLTGNSGAQKYYLRSVFRFSAQCGDMTMNIRFVRRELLKK
jgi:hypothetical protein